MIDANPKETFFKMVLTFPGVSMVLTRSSGSASTVFVTVAVAVGLFVDVDVGPEVGCGDALR